MVSSSAPHAGHLVLVALPIRLRYVLSGTCVGLSCTIRLAAPRLISLLLMELMNFAEGVDLSIRRIFLPRGDCLHLSVQLVLSASWYVLLIAAGLIRSGFLR
jgi:hypothetical protein